VGSRKETDPVIAEREAMLGGLGNGYLDTSDERRAGPSGPLGLLAATSLLSEWRISRYIQC
jgi:hypothetical protein